MPLSMYKSNELGVAKEWKGNSTDDLGKKKYIEKLGFNVEGYYVFIQPRVSTRASHLRVRICRFGSRPACTDTDRDEPTNKGPPRGMSCGPHYGEAYLS